MPETAFSVQVRILEGCAVLDLGGDINAFAEASLNAAYAEAEHSSPSVIILNLTNVGYINSTGIALIVGLLAKARKTKRQLAVYGISDHYREIFEITRLADFLRMYPDEQSAVQSAA